MGALFGSPIGSLLAQEREEVKEKDLEIFKKLGDEVLLKDCLRESDLGRVGNCTYSDDNFDTTTVKNAVESIKRQQEYDGEKIRPLELKIKEGNAVIKLILDAFAVVVCSNAGKEPKDD